MSPDDIDKLTIGEARAIAERAGEALKILRELGIGDVAIGRGPAPVAVARHLHPVPSPSSAAEPFPCPACGREGPQKPGEQTSAEECIACGNQKPFTGANGGIRTNKGVVGLSPDEIARRQALMATPAFGPDGEPA